MTREQMLDRFEGCILGGAAGDALGYAIEFSGEGSIFSTYGPEGIQTLEQASHYGIAHFSDDTQMTLFTAAGLAYGLEQGRTPASSDIWLAYLDWLGTQGDTSRLVDRSNPTTTLYNEASLHARRAPGNTCLSACTYSPHGGTPEDPVNDSCGCGGVMRVAPIGLLAAVRDDFDAIRLAAEAAALTHGHPLGWLPAAVMAEAVRIACLTDGEGISVAEALRHAIVAANDEVATRFAEKRYASELHQLVAQAVSLADSAAHTRKDDVANIHLLGEGWVGDQALAIAVYAALAYPDDFAAALRCAVNHGGDSDSTGAVCGNILGALIGRKAIEAVFDLSALEEKSLLAKVADSLY